MKVELLVNLKIGSGRIISAGTVFSDEFEPIPVFIMNRRRRGMAKDIADNKKIETSLNKTGGVSLLSTTPKISKPETTFKARTAEKSAPVKEKVVEKPVLDKEKKEKKVLLKKEAFPEE